VTVTVGPEPLNQEGLRTLGELDDAADAVLGLHQLKAPVDFVESDVVGDEGGDVDLAGQVAVDQDRDLVAALDPAEGRAGEAAAGDQQTRDDVEGLALAGDTGHRAGPRPDGRCPNSSRTAARTFIRWKNRRVDRDLDVGGTLREVFETYRAQAGVLLPVAFWLFLVVAIVNGLVAGSLALLLLATVFSIIVGTLYQGMVVGLVRDVQDGRRDSSTGELINSALPVLAPLIGAGVLAGFGIGFGFLLLIVPGLFLLTIWAVIAPVIVIERCGAIPAFSRSRELVRGHGWQVFGVIISAFLIALVAGIVFTAIADSLANGPIVRIVFNAIAATLTAPITALVAAVLYFRLTALRGAAEPSAPPAL
jgi:hypothetical protein